jgi:glucuronoarabinoxylan endo-1,4-beta-xylanase
MNLLSGQNRCLGYNLQGEQNPCGDSNISRKLQFHMKPLIKFWIIRLLLSPIIVAMASVSGQAQTGTVDWNSRYQRIDGFGASSAFSGFTWTTNMADMFFSTNNGVGRAKNGTNYLFTGIGLSLLRSQIQPGGYANGNEITLMQYAQARGAKIWSAPWSPQAAFKSNGSTVGGTILSSSYQAYANQLAGYVANLKSAYGITNFYALSIQNEPDATVTYVSCYWNAQQLHDFVPYLYNALVASNVGSTRIMLPESQNWPDYSNLVATAMSDTTSNMVGIVADHNYDGATGPANLTKNSYGKPLWETEVSTFDPNDGSISNGLYWAKRIYLFMTQAQVNAYHFWWLINLNADNEGLTDNNYVPDKRMYTMGQYSRFVRPNYYRIGASTTGSALISAFNDTNSGSFAIVAVNNTSSGISQTFNLNNFPGTVSSVTPWITSATMSLSNQTPVAVSGSSFNYTLPAMSVVTFVGQAVVTSTIPPTLTAIADQTMNAGQTLLVTNSATDPNVPPQSLTFNVLNGPAGAVMTSLDATDAQFSWRAPVSSAGTTNPVTVMVTDNGTLLSATNSYNVIVNPLSSQPTINSINTSGGQVALVLDGPQGPDYTVLTSTNLTDPLSSWQVLMTTNSPVTPVTLTIPITADPACFYRIQIGP